MKEAIINDDLPALTDAKLSWSKLRLLEWSNEDFHPVDSISAQAITEPLVLFTPEYATKLVKEGKISLGDTEGAHIMRKGDEFDLQIWNAALKPGATAKFVSKAMGHCEMILFSLLGNQLEFSVQNNLGEEVPINEIERNSIYSAVWEMPDKPEEFFFTITNLGSEPETFVIAIN